MFGTDSDLNGRLEAWESAGIIDAQQAHAIAVFEASRSPDTETRVPLAAEAVGYIGAALVLAAAALLVGRNWDSMSTPARLTALILPTAVVWAAGWWSRQSEESALRRLTSVLWALGAIGLAAVAIEAWVDVVDAGPDHAAVFVGLAALCGAVPAWMATRAPLQLLVLAALSVTLGLGLLSSLGDVIDAELFDGPAPGMVLVVVGLGWIAAGVLNATGWDRLAVLVGFLVIVIGAQVLRAGHDTMGVWVGLLVSVLLLAVGVGRSRNEVVLAGGIVLLIWLPQFTLYYLEDVLGAEATLLLTGLVLLGLATRVGSLRGRSRAAV